MRGAHPAHSNVQRAEQLLPVNWRLLQALATPASALVVVIVFTSNRKNNLQKEKIIINISFQLSTTRNTNLLKPSCARKLRRNRLLQGVQLQCVGGVSRSKGTPRGRARWRKGGRGREAGKLGKERKKG